LVADDTDIDPYPLLASHPLGDTAPWTARRLGLSRTQLYRRLRKYGLEPPPGSSGLLQG